MVKCPLCAFDNEDGALFCEQCKSDLSTSEAPMATPVETVPMAAIFDDAAMEKTAPIPVAEAEPVEAIAMAEDVPMAAVAVDTYEAIPMALAEPVTPVADAATEPIPVLGFEGLPKAEPMPAIPAPAPIPAASAPPAPPPAPAPTPGFVPAAAPAPSTPGAPAAALPAGSQPRLKVMRGLKVGVEFPIYGDYNYIGRADDKPVDIDLEDQEPPDRVWCSRQHAVIHFDESAGTLTLEDLNSSNGTYVNRTRVYPGEKKALSANDVVQIGTVHMKLLV